MGERDWLECTDPNRMLKQLGYLVEGRSPRWYDWLSPWSKPRLDWHGNRKLRLFACACARRVGHLFPSPACWQAISSAEGFAEGQVSGAELEQAAEAATAVALEESETAFEATDEPFFHDYLEIMAWEGRSRALTAWVAAWAASDPDLVVFGARMASLAAARASGEPGQKGGASDREEQLKQCQSLRDLFGNPFRPLSLDPAWHIPTVMSLAQASYANRLLPSGHLDPDRLIILSDCLEEAGCTDAEILGHLRGPGPHVRGCWCLDLVRA
jgi:hypothetical protein